ncbi:MAG TPA: hypothetical protein ENJ84_15125 [Gammaproteobacteria bacterium]|nr:hypothetical protein [Gammaproteobacteria bacterium]
MRKIILGGCLLAAGFAAQAGENPFVEEVFVAPDQYQKDPPISGKMAADNCSACHGTQGRVFDEVIPPLAGMPKETFVKLMMRFKSDKYPAIIMNKVARAFTDGEIERMGEYFEKQPATPWLEPGKSE